MSGSRPAGSTGSTGVLWPVTQPWCSRWEGVRPAAVDEADRDEVRAPFERRPNPALMGDYLRALPENKPVIAGLFVDGAGHVFVVPETSRGDAGTAIDVFREDGVFLGRFEPSRMAPRPAAFIASRLRCPESRG